MITSLALTVALAAALPPATLDEIERQTGLWAAGLAARGANVDVAPPPPGYPDVTPSAVDAPSWMKPSDVVERLRPMYELADEIAGARLDASCAEADKKNADRASVEVWLTGADRKRVVIETSVVWNAKTSRFFFASAPKARQVRESTIKDSCMSFLFDDKARALLANGAPIVIKQRAVRSTGVAVAPGTDGSVDVTALIERSNALAAQWFTPGPALFDVLADVDDIRAFVEPAERVWATDANAVKGAVDAKTARALDVQLQNVGGGAPPPATGFTRAYVDSGPLTTSIAFLTDSQTMQMDWLWRKPGVAVLMSAPYGVMLGGPVKFQPDDDAVLFEKRDGKWTKAAAPAAPTGCVADLERLKKRAKSLYIAEESYRAEMDRYSNDLVALGVPAEPGVDVKIEKLSATTFLARLTAKGSVVTIDENMKLTVVTDACASGPKK